MKTDDMNARAEEGATKVLSHCLALRSGESVAIFYDETTKAVGELLARTAKNMKLHVLPAFIPLHQQRRLAASASVELGDAIENSIQHARSILTCISSETATTAFRKALINDCTGADRRLGHMPGATLSTLAYALNIDYDAVRERCQDLAIALTLGAQAQVRTYTRGPATEKKKEAVLHLDLGGLKRSPITSTGTVPLGTWGNLPGGETFIAPVEGSATGSFLLTGAFSQRVLEHGEHVELQFASGQLAECIGSPEALHDFQSLLRTVNELDPANFSNFAELGIGANTGIARLTGNSLIDEKCDGTAHIAIGGSKPYGGEIDSPIHEDLVSWNPDIFIDDQPVLLDGRFVFDANYWRDSLDRSRPFQLEGPTRMVARSNIATIIEEDGRLFVRRDVSSMRVCIYPVGEPLTSKFLSLIIRLLPPLHSPYSLREFLNQVHHDLGVPTDRTLRALTILSKHGLIWSPSTGGSGDPA